MFKFIEGLPDDVLAVEAIGKVTHEDYRDRLIPRAEAMMGHGSDPDALCPRGGLHRVRAGRHDR